jgi:hypothetical protein
MIECRNAQKLKGSVLKDECRKIHHKKITDIEQQKVQPTALQKRHNFSVQIKILKYRKNQTIFCAIVAKSTTGFA